MSINKELNSLSDWLKVIAEPNRLKIIDLLMQGVQCNCEMGDKLQMAPNLISHHLSVLRQAGIVDVERDSQDGRWLYYSINKQKVTTLMDLLEKFFDLSRIQPRVMACGPKKKTPIVSK